MLIYSLLKETKQWGGVLSSESLHLSSVSVHAFYTLCALRPCTGQFKVTQEWVPADQRTGQLCSIWKYGCSKNEQQLPANCLTIGIRSLHNQYKKIKRHSKCFLTLKKRKKTTNTNTTTTAHHTHTQTPPVLLTTKSRWKQDSGTPTSSASPACCHQKERRKWLEICARQLYHPLVWEWHEACLRQQQVPI